MCEFLLFTREQSNSIRLSTKGQKNTGTCVYVRGKNTLAFTGIKRQVGVVFFAIDPPAPDSILCKRGSRVVAEAGVLFHKDLLI